VRPEMVRAAIARVHAGAARAGRDPTVVELVLWTACAASDHSPAEAIEAVKANVARAAIRRLPLPVASCDGARLEAIRAVYDYAHHSQPGAPHARLVPDALVAEFAVAGTTEACAAQLAALGDLGLHEITLAVPDAAFDDREAVLARARAAARRAFGGGG